MKLEEALLLGSAYYRVLEGTIEELGDYGEEVYTHVYTGDAGWIMRVKGST